MTGAEFRALRKQLGFSQIELGWYLDRTRQHIARVETAETVPPIYALAIRHLVQRQQAVDAAA